MDPNSLPMKRKRRRRTLACEECRRRKVRCDREQPCANCVQAYKPEHCFYQPDPMVTKSPPMRAGHVRKLSEGPGSTDRIDRESRGGFHGGPADRTGSLESDWPGSMTGTGTSSASVTGASTPARYVVLPAPGSGAGPPSSTGNPYYRHDDQMSRTDSTRDGAFPSPGSVARGPLPALSTVTGESEVSSLKEQVRRLENRLALTSLVSLRRIIVAIHLTAGRTTLHPTTARRIIMGLRTTMGLRITGPLIMDLPTTGHPSPTTTRHRRI
ncbi:hypothetical protein Sste5344_004250 [Sporothrix stenoceras]